MNDRNSRMTCSNLRCGDLCVCLKRDLDPTCRSTGYRCYLRRTTRLLLVKMLLVKMLLVKMSPF